MVVSQLDRPHKDELTALSTEHLLVHFINYRNARDQIESELHARYSRGDPTLVDIYNKANGGSRVRPQQQTRLQQHYPGPDEVQKIWEAVVSNEKLYNKAVKVLAATDWDRTDPKRLMRKPPEEVDEFLESCRYEVGYYKDMYETRRNLLTMIFDAYFRSVGRNQ